MAEFSMFPWETESGTGDGAFSYDQDQANDFFRYFDVSDPDAEGIARGVMNELAPSDDGVNQVTIDIGAAICYGRYWSTTPVVFAIPNTFPTFYKYRIFLRAEWSSNTIRLTIRDNMGIGGYPAPVVNPGVEVEIPIYRFESTGLLIQLQTDERVDRRFTGVIDDNNFELYSLGQDRIVNQARTVFQQSDVGWDITNGVAIRRTDGTVRGSWGVPLPDEAGMGSPQSEVSFTFRIPPDQFLGNLATSVEVFVFLENQNPAFTARFVSTAYWGSAGLNPFLQTWGPITSLLACAATGFVPYVRSFSFTLPAVPSQPLLGDIVTLIVQKDHTVPGLWDTDWFTVVGAKLRYISVS